MTLLHSQSGVTIASVLFKSTVSTPKGPMPVGVHSPPCPPPARRPLCPSVSVDLLAGYGVRAAPVHGEVYSQCVRDSLSRSRLLLCLEWPSCSVLPDILLRKCHDRRVILFACLFGSIVPWPCSVCLYGQRRDAVRTHARSSQAAAILGCSLHVWNPGAEA